MQWMDSLQASKLPASKLTAIAEAIALKEAQTSITDMSKEAQFVGLTEEYAALGEQCRDLHAQLAYFLEQHGNQLERLGSSISRPPVLAQGERSRSGKPCQVVGSSTPGAGVSSEAVHRQGQARQGRPQL